MALVQSIEYPPHLSSPISLSFPRSRDSFASSGRGGSGNIRRSSVGREARPSVDVRGSPASREIEPSSSSSRFVSVGRGGKGNLQPPSPPADLATHPRTAAIISQHKEAESRYEEQVRKCHKESTLVLSSGRGGHGNISNNRRSKSRPPSSGRKASNNPEHSIIDTLHLMRPKGFSSLKLGSRTQGTSTSRTRAESTEDPPCSPTAPHNAPEKRTKRKHSFLKAWNKSSLPPPPPPPSLPDHIRVSTETEGSGQVVYDLSADNSDIRVDERRNSRGGASLISTCSSGSGSIFSSQMSTQSLPVLPEDREYVSFLDF